MCNLFQNSNKFQVKYLERIIFLAYKEFCLDMTPVNFFTILPCSCDFFDLKQKIDLQISINYFAEGKNIKIS